MKNKKEMHKQRTYDLISYKLERERERERGGRILGGAAEFIELATVGEDDESNLSIAENRKLIS